MMKDVLKKVFRFLLSSGLWVLLVVSFFSAYFPYGWCSFWVPVFAFFPLDVSDIPLYSLNALVCFVFWGFQYLVDFWYDFLSPLVSRGWSSFKRLFSR